MSEKLKCESCNFTYRADKKERCPYCGWKPKIDPDLVKGIKARTSKPESNWGQLSSSEERKSSSRSFSAHTESAGFAELIEAQNRTTSAVRSMAIFFFITLCSTLLGYFFVTWGAAVSLSSGGGEFLSFLGWLVILVGFIWALVAGLSELGRSEIRR